MLSNLENPGNETDPDHLAGSRNSPRPFPFRSSAITPANKHRRRHLAHLTRKQSEAYIFHRLAVAGNRDAVSDLA